LVMVFVGLMLTLVHRPVFVIGAGERMAWIA
jgi:hypothetical protein